MRGGTAFYWIIVKAVMSKRRKEASERPTSPEGNRKRDDGPETPGSMDMQDSQSDLERLKQDTSFVMLPDVSDIPGQEHITSAGPMGEMSDVTASSDDEEGIRKGADIINEEDEVEIVMGTEADVTDEDLILLGAKEQDMDLGDDELIAQEGLDDTDFDGESLNEAPADVFSTGDDLDVLGAEANDNPTDAMSQGDEENDYYSLGSDDNDNMTEGTP